MHPPGNDYVENNRAQALLERANKLIARLDPPLNDKHLDKKAVLGLHKSKLLGVENDQRYLDQALDRYLDKSYNVNMEIG